MAESENKAEGPLKKIAERYQASPVEALSKLLKDYFFAIAGAAVLALVLRVYVVEAFRIPTDFMSPALVPGDHIFVNKVAYSRLLGSQKPAAGDIVVFSFPNDPAKDYIKRVVAVEGDSVEIRANELLVDGKQISRALGPDKSDELYEESLGDHKYVVQWKGALPDARKMIQVKVPPGNVFVLGDNRAKGQDSRAYGFLPVSNIQGRANWIWFSTGASGGGALGVRWSRLMTRVN